MWPADVRSGSLATQRGGDGVVDTSPVDSPLDAYPGYRLEAKGRQAAEDERLRLLDQVFDPGSRRRRELVRSGWRCLEVGAGRGSMAAWLAERVGPSGQVVAIDVDVGYLARLDVPNLVVRRHDILNDPIDDLDPGSFDLVCSRLMLFWLAGRQERAVQHMVQCLRPGGWLIDEDTGSIRTAGGLPLAATTRSSGASRRRCLTGAACRTSTTRPAPRWCAAPARGRGGGRTRWTPSAAGGWPTRPYLFRPRRSTRRSSPRAWNLRCG
jgi:SAM-dependent methyltransferase